MHSNRPGCVTAQRLTEPAFYADYDLTPILFGRWSLVFLKKTKWSGAPHARLRSLSYGLNDGCPHDHTIPFALPAGLACYSICEEKKLGDIKEMGARASHALHTPHSLSISLSP